MYCVEFVAFCRLESPPFFPMSIPASWASLLFFLLLQTAWAALGRSPRSLLPTAPTTPCSQSTLWRRQRLYVPLGSAVCLVVGMECDGRLWLPCFVELVAFVPPPHTFPMCSSSAVARTTSCTATAAASACKALGCSCTPRRPPWVLGTTSRCVGMLLVWRVPHLPSQSLMR